MAAAPEDDSEFIIYSPDHENRERFGASEGKLNEVLARKKLIIATLKREMFDPLLTSYAFDLTPPPTPMGGEPARKVIVKFYAANSGLYLWNANPMKEIALVPDLTAKYIKRYSSKLHGRLVKTLGSSTDLWNDARIFDEMRANLTFAEKVEEYSAFRNKTPHMIYSDRCADMEFVTDTSREFIDVVSGTLRGGMLMGLVYSPSAVPGAQIRGLCRGFFREFKAPSEVPPSEVPPTVILKQFVLDRVKILIEGQHYCKKLIVQVADECARAGVQMVDISSIQTTAHMCYIRAFLREGAFSHCLLVRMDEFIKVYSLVDVGTVDAWLVGHNRLEPRDNPNRVSFGANLHLTFFRGDASFEKYAKTQPFLSPMDHTIDIMEVLCPETPGIGLAIDHYLGYVNPYNSHAKKAVFRIKHPYEYSAYVDQQKKEREDAYYSPARAESPVYDLPDKQPRTAKRAKTKEEEEDE
jgi:hypothetical protein